MRTLKFIFISTIIFVFFGCQAPRIKKKVVEEKREEEKVEQVSILKPEEKKLEEKSKGKATPEEIKKAIKGEDIPVPEVSKDKKFVKPEEINKEFAKIFENIYFDFDKYDIRPDAEVILKKIGDYLLKNPEIKILIEGHCDERGTREYNLVLGEQRALSARRFLVVMGVSPSRIFTVSYGEDMPLDPRSNEEAWAKNRRCEFKIEVGK